MSAAPAAEQTAATPEPTIDDLFAAAADELTTRTAEPEADKPTPAAAPESDAPDSYEEASADTPATGPERDESGRFKPKEGEPEAGKEPAADKQAEAEPDLRAQLATLQRQLESTRGNVDNAAKQAAEKARQEALAEAEQNERQRITRLLNEYEQQGHDVREARQQWKWQWEQEDQRKRDADFHQQRATTILSEVEVEGQQKLLTLYQHGAQVLAEDTGLTVDEVRGLWAEPDERQRFLRASMQAHMATKLPGAGFNREALNDYMATKVAEGQRIAAIKQAHSAEVKALRKELDKLTQQLNREEADGPALRGPETPARGGGPRRKEPATLDEAHAELERRLNATPQLIRS
jgi:hypothetical protein